MVHQVAHRHHVVPPPVIGVGVQVVVWAGCLEVTAAVAIGSQQLEDRSVDFFAKDLEQFDLLDGSESFDPVSCLVLAGLLLVLAIGPDGESDPVTTIAGKEQPRSGSP